MAVPNPDLPHFNPSGAGDPAHRPLQHSAMGNRPIGLGGSNRPIPLKPRAGEFPEEDEEDDDLEEESDDFREILRNAPAWLVSTVFHMVLLIVLGLLVIGSNLRPTDLEVEVGYTEDLGEQLEDASALASDTNLEVMDEPLAATSDLTKIETPVLAPPTLERIQLTPLDVTDLSPKGSSHAPGIDLALSGRSAGSRQGLLKKYGGTKGTESAVELGLAWLAEQQRADGSWSLVGPYPDGGRAENTAAATAMALLAFQGHGDTHRDGRYQKTVSKGWDALLKMQDKQGRFVGSMPKPVQMLYTHAQCTIAVCEIYGMTNESRFLAPAKRAVEFALSAQDKEKGGWRYQPRMDSDTSVTGWFVMALQSARMAKLKVPNESLREISRYLDSAAVDDGRQYLGWPQDDPRLVEGVSALLESPVAYDDPRSEQNVYYWYYATQAAHHMEGAIWEKWNERMRVELPAHQIKDGPQTGSWDSQFDKWGNEGGRLFVTCLSIYNLEVYYRHLPIYSGYAAINQLPPIDSLDDLPDGEPVDDNAAPEDANEETTPKAEAMPQDPNAKDAPLEPTVGKP